ncbi:MAG: alpha/beta hydrolase [Pseudomonadota bacterium]
MTAITQIQARGLSFTAEVAGPEQGPLVVLLHGFPQTRYTWRAELPALAAAGYRCVAYDQRGYSAGARPQALSAYRPEEMIADVLAIASELGADQFHLVGHDWGGQIAWCTAVLHPERVTTLAVISRPHPAAFLRAMREDPAQAARSGHHQKFQDAAAADELLANDAAQLRDMFTKWGGVPAADAQAYLDTLGERDALDAAINWYRAVRETKIDLASLPPVTMPALYVWGTGDETVGRMAAEGTAAMVNGPYQFIQLDDVGHFVTDAVPGVFTRQLLDHLAAA